MGNYFCGILCSCISSWRPIPGDQTDGQKGPPLIFVWENACEVNMKVLHVLLKERKRSEACLEINIQSGIRPKCGHVLLEVSCWTLILNYKLQYDIIYKLVLSGSTNINSLCGWTLQAKINQRSSDQDAVHTLHAVFQTDFLAAPSWTVSKPNHQKKIVKTCPHINPPQKILFIWNSPCDFIGC